MISRKYETVVGIFVVTSLVALLIMVLVIAQQEGLFQTYVEYHTVFKNASGLKINSEVHLSGVTVGNVTSITINPDGTTTITFNVMKKYSDRVREDTKASIGYMGLLGDKSLDLNGGTPGLKPILPEGVVSSIEPLDITQLLARAGPSLEKLEKTLDNLATLTAALGPEGNFSKAIDQIKQITTKINQGQGSLGLFVNDPKLYENTTKMVTSASKVATDMEQGKGAMGTLISDEKFKAQMQAAMTDLQASSASIKKSTAHLEEASQKLPEMAKKLDSFLGNLQLAGKGLPSFVSEGTTTFSDWDKATKAAQKSWLLRWYIPTPKEHTLRLDAEAGKDGK